MIEDRLREALRDRAGAFTADPTAWSRVEHRVRDRRRRARLAMAAVPVAAGVTAVVAVLGLGGGADRGDMTSRVTAQPTLSDAYEAQIVENPPLGQVLTIVEPSQGIGPGLPRRLWFTAVLGSADPALCEAYQNPEGGSVASCSADPPAVATSDKAWRTGGNEAFPLPKNVLSYGPARAVVTGVAAVTRSGTRIPGTVHRLAGAPMQVWSVTYPRDAHVTAFEFTGAGGKVVQREDVSEEPTLATVEGKTVGPRLRLSGGVSAYMYETGTLIWWHDGQAVGADITLENQVLTDTGGRPMSGRWQFRDGLWFGVARAGTDHVTLTLKDGQTLTVTTVPDPWGKKLALFSTRFLPSTDIYAEGYTITGYNAKNAPIWREIVSAHQPLWSTPTPS